MLSAPAILVSGGMTPAAQTSGEYDYQLIDSGTAVEITGYHGVGGDVTLPGIIDGKPVTSLGFRAFHDQTSLTSVTFPTA